MSIGPPFDIIWRIKTATPASPIAVFRHRAPGVLRAVFAATAQSQRDIAAGEGLVGIYHRDHDLADALVEMHAATYKPALGGSEQKRHAGPTEEQPLC